MPPFTSVGTTYMVRVNALRDACSHIHIKLNKSVFNEFSALPEVIGQHKLALVGRERWREGEVERDEVKGWCCVVGVGRIWEELRKEDECNEKYII